MNIINNNTKPINKILKIGYSLYASKKYRGNKILEYSKKEELKSKNKCLLDNSSWFGNLEIAKSYKTKNTHIYKWKIKKITKLFTINHKNEFFLKNIFANKNIKLTPSIKLSQKQIKTMNYNHPYLQMTNNEKAYFEFCFAFGYITLEEQYKFMKLIKYLINNKFIEINTREGKSIIRKINMKINYYHLSKFFTKKEKYNRLSFYLFDKHAIMNFCRLVNNKKYNISGVYQKNDKSFWFPDFIIYKMNIKEYILFNPHHNLIYDKVIE